MINFKTCVWLFDQLDLHSRRFKTSVLKENLSDFILTAFYNSLQLKFDLDIIANHSWAYFIKTYIQELNPEIMTLCICTLSI